MEEDVQRSSYPKISHTCGARQTGSARVKTLFNSRVNSQSLRTKVFSSRRMQSQLYVFHRQSHTLCTAVTFIETEFSPYWMGNPYLEILLGQTLISDCSIFNHPSDFEGL